MSDAKIILVDKPAGWTSFDVVAKIRGAIRARYAAQGKKATKRQLKVGHAGTLDPFATGLLVVLLGDACSRSDSFLKLDKTYEATCMLGITSTTGDLEGELSRISKVQPSLETVTKALQTFVGEISQTPPAYSAIKINGERAYTLARKGKKFEIPSRKVTIYSLELLKYTYPEIRIRVHVSSGTYIRSLVEDIGIALGTGAYCSQLQRTTIGSMHIADAQTVEAVVSGIQLHNDE